MTSLVPTSVYTARAKAEVASAADALKEHWTTEAAIEEAATGTGSDQYVHCAGMVTALGAVATDLRS